MLFDVQQRQTLAELSTPFLKYAVWSSDMSQVALLSKHAIIIADKRLQNSTTGRSSISSSNLLIFSSPLLLSLTRDPWLSIT